MTSKEDFLLGFAHINLFIDNYYDCLALTDVELALAMGKQITVPQSLLKGVGSLKTFDDGEICVNPLGIVSLGGIKTRRIPSFYSELKMWKDTRILNIRISLLVSIIATRILKVIKLRFADQLFGT